MRTRSSWLFGYAIDDIIAQNLELDRTWTKLNKTRYGIDREGVETRNAQWIFKLFMYCYFVHFFFDYIIHE